MSGISIQCDKCGVSFRGEQKSPNWHRAYHWSQKTELIKEAKKLGWTGDFTRDSENDLCPNCSKIDK